MSKKTIAIDVDDVLASSAQGFVDFSNKQWGMSLTVEDYKEHWGQMWQVDIHEYRRRASIVYDSKTVKTFQAHQDAKEVLQALKKRFRLVITTSRVKEIEKETAEWLDYHYNGLFSEIHLGGFYDKITEDSHKPTKAELCQRIGAHYLIDDHPKHCFATAEVGIPSLLFGEYPWSRNLGKLPNGVTRVMNWREVQEYFDGQQS
jgi:uncharacterized HAD superfamily protein